MFLKNLIPSIVIAIAPWVQTMSAEDASFTIRDGDRVVFYGDSITDSEWYPTLVESYVLTRHPTWRNTFTNRGVSGDGSGSVERYKRDVLAQKPNVCTFNMGFNDGGYFTFSPEALSAYIGHLEQTIAATRQADSALRLVLMSPIPNELTVSQDPRWVSHASYPYAMLQFGNAEARLAERLHVPFIGVGQSYGQSVGLAQVAVGPNALFSRDGVHPTRAGQSLIAYHVLRGLGAEAVVASVEIDAEKGTMTDSVKCTISGLTVGSGPDGELRFDRLCDALPLPLVPEIRPFAFVVRYEDTLSRDWLRVTGLKAAAYRLVINDIDVAEVSAAELAEGLNLSAFADAPQQTQALAVLAAVRAKQVADFEYFRAWINSGAPKADGTGQPLASATADERAQMERERQAITALTDAAYRACIPQRQRVTLSPIARAIPRFASLAAADVAQPRLVVAMKPLALDWNAQQLIDQQISVTVANPGVTVRSAELTWNVTSNWQITPRTTTLTLEPGATRTLTFDVTAQPGEAVLTPPTLTTQWAWSAAWPAPTSVARQIELAPRLRIAHAKQLPTFTGTWADWQQATPVTLDERTFINPAVPGRRAMWHGPADLSAVVRLQWTPEALLIGTLVRDDQHVQRASAMMAWSEDSLMFATALFNGGQPVGRQEFLFAAYADRVVATGGSDAGAAVRCVVHQDPAAGTCLYEVSIPWARLAATPVIPGMKFCWTVCVNDTDNDPAKGFNYLAWTPGVNYGKSPNDLAVLELAP